jgi:hypothetical protein
VVYGAVVLLRVRVPVFSCLSLLLLSFLVVWMLMRDRPIKKWGAAKSKLGCPGGERHGEGEA